MRLRKLTGSVELKCRVCLSEVVYHGLGRTRLAESVEVLRGLDVVREALVPLLELFA